MTHARWVAWVLASAAPGDVRLALDLAEADPSDDVSRALELFVRDHPGNPATNCRAIDLRAGRPGARELLVYVLEEDPHPSCRLRAARGLPDDLGETAPRLSAVLAGDGYWMVRAELGRRLVRTGQPLTLCEVALGDPHWRVRHAVASAVVNQVRQGARVAGEVAPWLVDNALVDPLANGAVGWIVRELQLDLDLPTLAPPVEAPLPEDLADPDPAVVRHLLNEWSADELRDRIDDLVTLVGFEDDVVRRVAARSLARHGSVEQAIALCRRFVGDRRLVGYDEAQLALDRMPWHVRSAAAAALLASAAEAPAVVAWARACSEDSVADESSPSPQPPSLSRDEASAILERPDEHRMTDVVRACRVVGTNPMDYQPSRPDAGGDRVVNNDIEVPELEVRPTQPRRFLRWDVSCLGLSGHYGLDKEGFVEGVDRGVNLLFWEPSYHGQTQFMRSLDARTRRELVVVAGSFSATAKEVVQDLERALRRMHLEVMPVFLAFWVRSKRRFAEARTALEAAVQRGDLLHYGLSTHDRGLAVWAIEQGIDPVMVRYSAAHPGAADVVFPVAALHQRKLLTFSSLCYGRLLQPSADEDPPLPVTAADCYRFTLAPPCVASVFSAPRNHDELRENLAVLDDPTLPPERHAALRARGQRVLEDDRAFARLIAR